MPKQNPIIKAYNDGKTEGERDTRNKVLTYVEKEFMAPHIKKGDPMYDELLRIAAGLSELMGGRG